MHGHVYVIDCNRIWERTTRVLESLEGTVHEQTAANMQLRYDDGWCMMYSVKSVNSSEKVWFLPPKPGLLSHGWNTVSWLAEGGVTLKITQNHLECNVDDGLRRGKEHASVVILKTTMLKFHTLPQTKIWVRNSIRVMNVPSSDRWVTMQPVACLTLRCLRQNSTWFWSERCLIASFHTCIHPIPMKTANNKPQVFKALVQQRIDLPAL